MEFDENNVKQSYYNREEGIAWGPVSLQEIKDDLDRPIVKPEKRHTIHCDTMNKNSEFVHCDSSTEKIEEIFQELLPTINESTSTEYYTPNGSLKTSNNSDFIQKISKVINEPQSNLSVYSSVLEQSKPPLSANAHIDNCGSEFALNDTCVNFIKSAIDRATVYDIANFQHTLIENSTNLSDAEHLDASQYLQDTDSSVDTSDVTDLVQTKESDKEFVIVISDDEEGMSVYDRNGKVAIESVKMIDSFDISENSFDLNRTENKFQRQLTIHGNVELDDSAIPDSEEDSNSAEMNESSSTSDRSFITDQDNKLEQNNEESRVYQLPEKLSTIEENSHNTSLITIPEIDLKQFDDTCDSPQFDDTLEEINRALKLGLEYSMSDENNISDTPVKIGKPQFTFIPSNAVSGLGYSMAEPISTPKIISGSFSQKHHVEKVSSEIDSTLKIPQNAIHPVCTEKNRNNAYKLQVSPRNRPFKVPDIPFRSKLLTPSPKLMSNYPRPLITPPKSSTSNFKNIVSPVALYIKNSPRVMLKQNVPVKELSKISAPKVSKISSKENFPDFPEVVYTPTKNQLVMNEKEIILPTSIKKLNVREPLVVKHEGRIKRDNLTRIPVGMKLITNDAAINSVNESRMLNDSRDVSVLKIKQAFIK